MALESMATLIIQKAALAIVLHSVYRKSTVVVVDYTKILRRATLLLLHDQDLKMVVTLKFNHMSTMEVLLLLLLLWMLLWMLLLLLLWLTILPTLTLGVPPPALAGAT